MNELDEIEDQLAVIDQAAAVVIETYRECDYLLAGAMASLLSQRIDWLLRGERLVAGTPDRFRYHAALRVAIDAEQAARSLFACFDHQQTEQPETLGADRDF